MSSTEPAHFNEEQRRILLQTARAAIRHGLETGTPLRADPANYPPELQAQRASFVTLNRGGQLRGCIGHLEAIQPLIADVAENAFAAAFRDPRFPPLESREYGDLSVHISVLTPPEPMQFESEEDLLRQIQPGLDGLILSDGRYRGTFLPSVWESLSDPAQFLSELKQKAGLPSDYWSDTLQVACYHTESFGD